jgi:hypothetical protein
LALVVGVLAAGRTDHLLRRLLPVLRRGRLLGLVGVRLVVVDLTSFFKSVCVGLCVLCVY